MEEKKLTYHEIKERELKVVEKYDDGDFDRYIKLLILAKKIFQLIFCYSFTQHISNLITNIRVITIFV